MAAADCCGIKMFWFSKRQTEYVNKSDFRKCKSATLTSKGKTKKSYCGLKKFSISTMLPE